jgi:hypothetical protein
MKTPRQFKTAKKIQWLVAAWTFIGCAAILPVMVFGFETNRETWIVGLAAFAIMAITVNYRMVGKQSILVSHEGITWARGRKLATPNRSSVRIIPLRTRGERLRSILIETRSHDAAEWSESIVVPLGWFSQTDAEAILMILQGWATLGSGESFEG